MLLVFQVLGHAQKKTEQMEKTFKQNKKKSQKVITIYPEGNKNVGTNPSKERVDSNVSSFWWEVDKINLYWS